MCAGCGEALEKVTQDYALIPVGTVRGVPTFAKVDASDADWAKQWRWTHVSMRSGKAGVYAARWVEDNGARRLIHMSRDLLGLARHPGRPTADSSVADHINGDTLDNRRENLRAVTQAENQQNKARRGAMRGAYYDAGRSLKWRAEAKVNKRRFQIGRFATQEEAARAAAQWRAEHMPYSREALQGAVPPSCRLCGETLPKDWPSRYCTSACRHAHYWRRWHAQAVRDWIARYVADCFQILEAGRREAAAEAAPCP